MAGIYLEFKGEPEGPYSSSRIRQLLDEGRISGTTPAWHKEMPDWSTAAEVVAKYPNEELVPFSPSTRPDTVEKSSRKRGWLGCFIIGIVGVILLYCGLGPMAPGIKKAKESGAMQQTHAIDLAMYSYANDHDGAYPDGPTSTAVFQKLIDGQYITDPTIFYLSQSGKTKPTSHQLTAENVCFDVTSGVTKDSPDDLPIVFSSGYTVAYVAGASAVRDANSVTAFNGMAVGNKSGAAHFIISASDGSISKFIPDTFDVGGKTYRQLRP